MSIAVSVRQKAVRASMLAAGVCLTTIATWGATPLLNFEFNEGSGATTTDSVNQLVGNLGGANRDAFQVSSDSPSGAASDKSLSLNVGNGTSVALATVDDSSEPILALATDAFTIEAWIKSDIESVRQFEGIGAYGGSYKLGMNNKELQFTLYGIVDLNSGLIVPQDEAWHHVAAVWEPGTGVTLYLDGAASPIAETRMPRAFTHNTLTIGAEGIGANALQGLIDRFRIHKAALTPEQLDSVAQTPKAPLASTLVAYSFNEADQPFQSAATVARPAVRSGSPVPSFVAETPSKQSGDFAMQFSTGQQIAFEDPNTVVALNQEDPSFTLQAWVKLPPGNPSARMVFFFSNGPGGAISFSVNSDRTVAVTTLGLLDAYSQAAIPDDGAWHHIAVVHENGKELRYYVDGQLGHTLPYTQGVIFTRTDTMFYIGSEPTGGLPFTGLVDRLKVTSGILTPEQLDFWPVPGVDPGAPSLSIETVERISWPTTPAGYQLQSSTDLGEPKDWTTVTNAPSVSEGSFYLLVPPTQAKVFYRLIKP